MYVQSIIEVTNKHTAKLHHVGSLYICVKTYALWVLQSIFFENKNIV